MLLSMILSPGDDLASVYAVSDIRRVENCKENAFYFLLYLCGTSTCIC